MSRIEKVAGVRVQGIAAHVEEANAETRKSLGGRLASQFAPEAGIGPIRLIGIHEIGGGLKKGKLNGHDGKAAIGCQLRQPLDVLELPLAQMLPAGKRAGDILGALGKLLGGNSPIDRSDKDRAVASKSELPACRLGSEQTIMVDRLELIPFIEARNSFGFQWVRLAKSMTSCSFLRWESNP